MAQTNHELHKRHRRIGSTSSDAVVAMEICHQYGVDSHNTDTACCHVERRDLQQRQQQGQRRRQQHQQQQSHQRRQHPSSSTTTGALTKTSLFLLIALLAFTTYRSEAFASTQRHSLFGGFGRRLFGNSGSSGTTPVTTTAATRGGASSATVAATAAAAATTTATAALNGDKHSGETNGSIDPTTILKVNGMNGPSLLKKNGAAAQSAAKKNGVSRYATIAPMQQDEEILASIDGTTANGNYNNNFNSNNNNNGISPSHPRRAIRNVEYVAETKLPTDIGQFQLRAYRVPGAPLGQEPCVIYARNRPPFNGVKVPVRIHDQCLTSEVFRSQRCDCKEQLQMALRYIQTHGGCIIYLQQEGRGIGLANKIAAYALQDHGLDTVDANLHLGFPEDSREYGVVPGILKDMGIESIELMTNNPRKVDKLERVGVNVERTLPMVVPQVNPYNRKYMETKRTRMNHQNLAALLARDPLVPEAVKTANGVMAPRKSLANEYINNGTEFTANAVQVSLMLEEEEEAALMELQKEEEGAKAHEDGYCFGRQSVEDAISAISRGEMVVVVDDMDRENEGDFIMAADLCTDLDMARIVRYSSGVVCVAMEEDRLEKLEIPPMVTNNQDPKGTAFHVTVDASREHGITTGISATDRAKTIQLLAHSKSTATDFTRPGHIFPLRSRSGGVLTRDGHTEASVDLARLAGREPVGVLCEIVSEENPTEMMRLPEIKRFCKRHGFVLTSIVDIAQYRRETGL